MPAHTTNFFLHFCLVFLFFTNCHTPQPCALHKLNNGDILRRAIDGLFVEKSTPVYDQNGNKVTEEDLAKYSPKKYGYIQWANCKDELVKLEIRDICEEDLILRARIDSLYNNNIDVKIKWIKFSQKDTILQRKMIEHAYLTRPIETIPVNCNSILVLLKEAFNKDQKNRNDDNEYSLLIDRENLTFVKNIIDQCGFSAIEALGEDAVYYSFMIVQHAPPQYMTMYFPYFERAAEKGLLKKSTLALMVDRILVDKGEPQIYGTQVRILPGNKVVLFPIRDSFRVNILRDSIGLPPLSEYLQHFKE